jgi:dTMP kinase
VFGNNEILSGFTVIEGIDGAGTSTQRSLLSKAYEAAGRPVYDTWEPSDGPVGRLIRQALRAEIILDQGTIARLFAADRQEHLHGTGGIAGRTRAGQQVVCDRYLFSSLAYQSLYLTREEIWALNRAFPLPEALIFIDVDLATSAERRRKRGEAEELYDAERIQEHVRQAYHGLLDELAATRPEVRLLRLDGGRDIATTHRAICEFLKLTPADIR